MGRVQNSILRGVISLLLAGGLCSQAYAEDSPTLVGRVIDIDGPRLYTDRLKPQTWFQAYAGMNTYLLEKLRTDKETQAVLEFLVGGRAGIGRNSKVEIISDSKFSKLTGSALRVDAGNFWAKFDRQDEVFEIHTSGGVIGIEGTELLVGVDEESGVTEVLLFEGQVSVVDTKGNKKTMFPGDYAEFGGSKGMCVLSYPAPSLRTLVVERFPKFSSFLASQDVTAIPNPASPTLIRGFNKKRDSLLTVLDTARTLQGGALASGLSASATSGQPAFTWSPVSGAQSYAFYMTQDPEMSNIVFSSRVDGSSFQVPTGAPSVEAGQYSWGVVALDGDGKPLGNVSMASFQSSGWSSGGLQLEQDG